MTQSDALKALRFSRDPYAAAAAAYEIARLKALNAELAETLKLAVNELNIIRARDGAPQHVQWGPNGQVFVTDACTKEWWNELTERCFAAITRAQS